MARREIVLLEDDTDGSEAAETVSFALDGAVYEIDLSEDNAEALREALAPWLGHARRIGGRRRSVAPAAKSSSTGSGSTSAIREWAIAEGYEVSSRGRISADVRGAYEAAH